VTLHSLGKTAPHLRDDPSPVRLSFVVVALASALGVLILMALVMFAWRWL
jgi:hypothetical protein